MANRQLTVLNPGGYQELLQSADTLVVEGVVDMSSNLIGGLPAPTSDNDAARKKYVDDEIAGITPTTPNLQAVTTAGSTTTTGATFGGDLDIGGGNIELTAAGAITAAGKITTTNTVKCRDVNSDYGGFYFTSTSILPTQADGSYATTGLSLGQSGNKFNNLFLAGDVTAGAATFAGSITAAGDLTVSGHIDVGSTTQLSESDAGLGSYNTLISNGTNGDVVIRGAELFIQDKNNANEAWAKFKADGSVELNHIASNTASTKLETTTNGVTVTGELTADSIDCGTY